MKMHNYDRKLALAVYTMVLLAILAMVLPEGSIVYFVLAFLAAMISWPIARSRAGQSIVPRWVISLAVLVAFAFFLFELLSGVHLIQSLAHFMIFVQVCKFFETKHARDYGQLIILSMLEMIVAAILSTSILFALLLLVYLALGSYTLLLYHFRREMELFERTGRQGKTLQPAAAALAGAANALVATPSWRFWRISASAGAVALAFGATLFVVFPRFGEGWLGRGMGGNRVITGFDDTPRLGVAGPIEQSNEIVMRVMVRQGGQPTTLARPMLLRGTVSMRYDRSGIWRNQPEGTILSGGREQRSGGRRAVRVANYRTHDLSRGVGPIELPPLRDRPLDSQLQVDVEMRPLPMYYLFAPYPVVAVASQTPLTIDEELSTGVLRIRSGTAAGVGYTVWTTVDGGDVQSVDGRAELAARATLPSPVIPEIRALAIEWTAGLDSPADKVEAIQFRLLRDFSYTLNLPSPGGDDPLVAFLTTSRVGHCQYFASAMTVMCQQLGIPARLVSGYKVIEHNSQGQYYIVRQKHAHAWCEVFLQGRGWVTFDPTPGAAEEELAAAGGLLGWLSHTADLMNYRFQQKVLNYSQGDRDRLVSRAWRVVAGAWQWLSDWGPIAGLSLLAATVSATAALLALGRVKRNKRGRRASAGRMQASGLWLDVLRILDRGRVRPPPAMTPREICLSLSNALPDVDGLGTLADLHYEVRYGGQELTAEQGERSTAVMHALALAMGRRTQQRPAGRGQADS